MKTSLIKNAVVKKYMNASHNTTGVIRCSKQCERMESSTSLHEGLSCLYRLHDPHLERCSGPLRVPLCVFCQSLSAVWAVSSLSLIIVSFWSTVQRCNERLLLVTEPDVNIDGASLSWGVKLTGILSRCNYSDTSCEGLKNIFRVTGSWIYNIVLKKPGRNLQFWATFFFFF